MNPDSPCYIEKGPNSSTILVPQLLEGNNYYTRARSMKRALRIQNKFGFIDGTLTKPMDPTDPLKEQWLRCNDIVITWIQNALSPEIKASTFYTDTAHQLWLDLEQRHTQ